MNTDKLVIQLDDDTTAIIKHGGMIVNVRQEDDVVTLTDSEIFRIAEQLKQFKQAVRIGAIFR